jgi:hypothetical protein
MGRIGKNKTLVSISIPIEWRDEIDRRATALSLTRAAYVTMIIEQWWAKGCPAISEPDRLMQINAQPTGSSANFAEGDQGPPRGEREKFSAPGNKNKRG